MTISLHAQKVFSGHERVKDFNAAWKLNEKREANDPLGTYGVSTGDVRHMSYRMACSIGTQVETLLTLVRPENVKFVLFDDLISEPMTVQQELTNFLGIRISEPSAINNFNPATVRRSQFIRRLTIGVGNVKRSLGIKRRFGILEKVNALNTRVEKYAEPSPETIQEMRLHFDGEITKIRNITGRSLADWS